MSSTQAINVYDLPKIRDRYAIRGDAGHLESSFMLSGVSCAGCVSTIERKLQSLPGVYEAEVNYSTLRARVLWDDAKLGLSDLLGAVHDLGYGAQPYDPRAQELALAVERRSSLRAIAVAAALGMQVMMMTVALYAGAASGMSADFEQLFRWLSLVLTGLVLVFPASSFFKGAWHAVRNRVPNMDLPVSLGLAIAYVGSFHATVSGQGEVYFESVVMFVLLLLCARHLQAEARRKSALTREAVAHGAPTVANRITGAREGVEVVPAEALQVGDRIRVLPGQLVPVDGVVLSGRGWVSEAVLSGESKLIERGPGDKVLGGALNQRNAIDVRVNATLCDSYLSQLVVLAERAAQQKPYIAQFADRVAAWFIGAILLLAGVVAVVWMYVDPQQWLPVTVSVLVVTCPCALSLATPTAIAAAIGTLARNGLVVINTSAVENLSRATHYLFDKTGTLTYGEFRVETFDLLGSLDQQRCISISLGLEEHSEHPIARSIASAFTEAERAPAFHVEVHPGCGLRGQVEGQDYWLGSTDFVAHETGLHTDEDAPAGVTIVVLANADEVLARFSLSDALRDGAVSLVAELQAAGKTVEILSGDREEVVSGVAKTLALQTWRGGCLPEAKASRVRELAERGEKVVMVGDGLNDTPATASACVSLVMGSGTDVTQANADAILVRNDLGDLRAALRFVPRVRRVIVQNLSWALIYNLIAVPSAAMGLVSPWMAALGMSASSALVALNSARLYRSKISS